MIKESEDTTKFIPWDNLSQANVFSDHLHINWDDVIGDDDNEFGNGLIFPNFEDASVEEALEYVDEFRSDAAEEHRMAINAAKEDSDAYEDAVSALLEEAAECTYNEDYDAYRPIQEKAYPIRLSDRIRPEHVQRKLRGLNIVLVRTHAGYVLASTTSGVGRDVDFCLAYLRAGNMPPLSLCIRMSLMHAPTGDDPVALQAYTDAALGCLATFKEVKEETQWRSNLLEVNFRRATGGHKREHSNTRT